MVRGALTALYRDRATAGTWAEEGQIGVLAKLRGPGKVSVQSLPFSRLAGRVIANMGPSGRGEGSVLGSFGDMLDGDN